VFRVGDHSGELYFVNSGKIEYVLESYAYKTIRSGVHFGEIDLIHMTPR
jgi:hypothetical protein